MEMSFDEFASQAENLMDMGIFDLNSEQESTSYVSPNPFQSYNTIDETINQYSQCYGKQTQSSDAFTMSPEFYPHASLESNGDYQSYLESIAPYKNTSSNISACPLSSHYAGASNCQVSSIGHYHQQAFTTSGAPSTLPTPPQSPPSSTEFCLESELNEIIDIIPEILDQKPQVLFSELRDVIHDLETNFGSNFQLFPTPPHTTESLEQNSSATNEEHLPNPVQMDSMWSGVTCETTKSQDRKGIVRRLSKVWEEGFSQGVYSDEEYEHLPDTPCVSDEDVEPVHNHETSCSRSPSQYIASSLSPVQHESSSSLVHPVRCPSPAIRPASIPSIRHSSLQYANAVSIEHNYCEKLPSSPPPTSSDHYSDTDEEIDVVSWCEIPKTFSTPCASYSSPSSLSSPTPTAPSSKSSAQVKRQLKMVIHESIKKKGRVGRPPKVPKPSITATKALPPVHPEVFEPVQKTLTHGKPASYTKRMREQHTEVLKTKSCKRRKTTAKDPEDDLEKRSNHNIMERNRRVNIRNLFQDLRSLVMTEKENERASKVHILSLAKTHIQKLEFMSTHLETEEAFQRQRNTALKRKLESLRNS